MPHHVDEVIFGQVFHVVKYDEEDPEEEFHIYNTDEDNFGLVTDHAWNIFNECDDRHRVNDEVFKELVLMFTQELDDRKIADIFELDSDDPQQLREDAVKGLAIRFMDKCTARGCHNDRMYVAQFLEDEDVEDDDEDEA